MLHNNTMKFGTPSTSLCLLQLLCRPPTKAPGGVRNAVVVVS